MRAGCPFLKRLTHLSGELADATTPNHISATGDVPFNRTHCSFFLLLARQINAVSKENCMACRRQSGHHTLHVRSSCCCAGGGSSSPFGLRSNSVSLSTYSSFCCRLLKPGAYTSHCCDSRCAHTITVPLSVLLSRINLHPPHSAHQVQRKRSSS